MKNLKLISLLLILISCAKDKPYKEVFKKSEVIEKSLINDLSNPGNTVVYNQKIEGDDANQLGSIAKDLKISIPDNVYLYMPTVEAGSYYSDIMPYFVGQEKLVSFEFDEKTLRVLALEIDERYKEKNNHAPILEIPLTHLDYKCRENSDDECSNEEEVNDDIGWSQKKYAELDFTKLEVTGFNSLNGFYDEIMNELYNCTKTKSTKIKSWKVDKETIDFVVERSMKKSLLCMDFSSFDPFDQGYTVEHHYKFKKLNSIASHDYNPVLYTGKDEEKFGFFKEGFKKLSADNRVVNYSEKVFMNRFSPKKKIVKYFLSENFFKPQYQSILETTKNSISIFNDGLKKAKAPFLIEIAKAPRNVLSDDLENAIILVEEPYKSGPLGYGPSIKNPINGEILQAQAVMYYGNMLWTVQSAYEDLILTEQQAKLDASKVELSKVSSKESATEMIGGSLNQSFKTQLHEYFWEKRSESEARVFFNDIADSFDMLTFQNAFKGSESLSTTELIDLSINQIKDRAELFSKYNMYSQDFINVKSLLAQVIKKDDWKEEDLIPWRYLSDSRKEEIIAIMMPKLWGPVLIHELGHNFGLRHNFNGSEDKDNYYSEAELSAIGVDQKIPYSSMMDYSASDINALPILGKYDIAALKFGYARKVDLATGEEADVGVSLALLPSDKALMPYMYCSDEGVYLNASCNRFDEGTTPEEIADHYIKSYFENLNKMNTKQDRLNFSSYNNFAHYRNKYRRTFFPLRKFFDSYELYQDAVKGGQIPATNETYKSYSKAVSKIADFLIAILNTEEAHCKIQSLANGQSSWYVLSELSRASCFSISHPMFKVIGQVGQPLSDIRDYENPQNTSDEIDVRGYWIDKTLALQTLLMRKHGVGPLDRFLESFVSADVKLSNGTSVKTALISFIDKITDSKSLLQIQGEQVLFDSTKTGFIADGVNRSLNHAFGFHKGKTHFMKIVLDLVKSHVGVNENGLLNPLAEKFSVSKYQANGTSPVETTFGTFYMKETATEAKKVLLKADLAELTLGKSSGAIQAMALKKVETSELSKILQSVVDFQEQQAASLYNSYKPIFDQLYTLDKKIKSDFVAGKTDGISPEQIEFLESLPLALVELSISEFASPQKLAVAFVEVQTGDVSTYKSLAEKIIEVKDISILRTLVSQTLNTKEHYEKIISAMAEVR